MTSLLDVDALTIGFGSAPPVVDDVSFSVRAGETLALVGESGSGKTLTCRSILRILPQAAQMRGGQISFAGKNGPVDLLKCSERQMRSIRGNRIAMIFQEPMTALNPVLRVGEQIEEVLNMHSDLSRAEAKARTIDMMEQVHLPDVERIYAAFPHQLSLSLIHI